MERSRSSKRSSCTATLPIELCQSKIAVNSFQISDSGKLAQMKEYASKKVTPILGSVANMPALIEAMKGIDVVISCLSAGGLNEGAEIQLIQAAKAAGVKRFIPSQFGNDFADLDLGTHPMADPKIHAVNELKKLKLDYLSVSCNCWMEYALDTALLSFNIAYEKSVLIPNDGSSYVARKRSSCRSNF